MECKIIKPGISDDCVEISVLPVSGGYFINQVALLSVICDYGYKPNILLGSSGGAITAYVGLCADWNTNGIYRVMGDMSSDIFVRSWWGPFFGKFLPSEAIGIFKNAFYKHGEGSGRMMKRYLTPASATRSEIWCGTYNKSTGNAEFFCNRCYRDSYVKDRGDDCAIPTIMRYADGDIDKMTLATYASSCIPTLLPSVKIDNYEYYDGGLRAASPLIPLAHYLPQCLKIVYFSSFNMEDSKTDLTDCSNIIGIGISAVTETVTGLSIADREFAIRLVMKCCEMNYKVFTDIEEPLKIYRRAAKAVMELYPKEGHQLNIKGFDPKTAIGYIKRIRKNYGVRLWWVE
jgi:predicted acylesterase/phospholipase RssA